MRENWRVCMAASAAPDLAISFSTWPSEKETISNDGKSASAAAHALFGSASAAPPATEWVQKADKFDKKAQIKGK